MRNARRASFLSIALSAIAVGCGGPPSDPDAGGGDAGPDPDRDAPRIVSASPDDGASEVGRDTAFEATFSEAMRSTLGAVRVRIEGEEADVDPVLADEDRLRIEPPDGEWPAASEVEVRIGEGFADRAGNALDRAYVYRFTTEDDAPPTVLSSDPAEGATDVSVRAGAVRIRFSEPMDQAAGTVRLEGGPGELDADAPAWSPLEVSYALRGLAHETAYRIVLEGFRDRQGNALDGSLEIGDGAIDFTTRGDDEAPRAVSSTPVEGQVDVLVGDLGGVVEVVFDEAMDASASSARLTAGTETSDVAITWIDDHTARFAVGGVALPDATHALELRALTDVAGNALATAPYLGDGQLDFTTGVDVFVPYVVASSPEEGTTDLRVPLAEIVLAFSEAMDPTEATVVATDDLSNSTILTGAWRAGGTVLAVPATALSAGRTYAIDVTGLRDLSGTGVSPAHAYLGDGNLDLAFARPTGASCAEPLLLEHADSVVGGRASFTITNAQRTRNNGSGWCDSNGIADTDAVILYRKTTPATSDPSGTGRALRIMTFGVTNRANIEVYAGQCDPRASAAPAARLLCVTGHDEYDQLLDLPAGDYYVWFSTADGSPFEIDLAFEEVATIPEGEACGDPYDTSSASYTAPATAGEPHVWNLPAGPHTSIDVGPSNAPSEGISCRTPDSEAYGDVVVEYTKASADSVLDVRVAGSAMEILTGACRADQPSTTRAGCISFASSSSPRRISAIGPSGPTYFWLAGTSSSSPFPGARLEVRELPPPTAPGSSCATAIPITPGASVAITPDHAERYFAPSCAGVDSNVTWYAFDTTATLTHVRTLGAGAIGLVDAASGRERSCLADATSTPLDLFAPAGTRVCVAVESGSAVMGLSIESIDYTGPGVTAPARLFIEPPNLDGTIWAGFGIQGDNWMALTPTRIWQNLGTALLFSAPRAGGAVATPNLEVDDRVLADDAHAIGEELFTLDFSAGGPRLFRLTDASGTFAPVIWDPGASYARSTRTFAFDGTAFYVADNISSTTTPRSSNIYRVSRDAPGTPVLVGSIDTVYNIESLAADETWLYFSAQESSSVRGLYRVRKADVAAGVGTPARIAALPALTTISLDSLSSPRYMFVRETGDVRVIEAPGGASPRMLGRIFDGVSGDAVMDYDRATGTLVVFSMHEDPDGDWYRFGP